VGEGVKMWGVGTGGVGVCSIEFGLGFVGLRFVEVCVCVCVCVCLRVCEGLGFVGLEVEEGLLYEISQKSVSQYIHYVKPLYGLLLRFFLFVPGDSAQLGR
jgi:hypothetical protein